LHLLHIQKKKPLTIYAFKSYTTMQKEMTSLPAQQISTKDKGLITVKFLARGMRREKSKQRFSRQLPGNNSQWGNCCFSFDIDAKEYDWLVVYNDLPREHMSLSTEKLCCPREKTILITTEPSSITVYGTDYLRQYGLIITSQEPWAIKHPNVVFTQPGLIWFYGFPYAGGKIITYDDMKNAPPPAKSKTISTVCSTRQGRLTLHYTRYHFTEKLKAHIPELDIFGHGVNPMNDKAEALDPYQYHIVIENHIFPHHMTEKLPDAFLGYTLPFYHGCPNATNYFPPESFIPIDMNDFDRTVAIIRSTLANNEYRDRLPYIIEARKLVLEKYNLFAVLDAEISSRNSIIQPSKAQGVIMCRHTLKFKKPLYGLRREVEKIFTKVKHLHW
jgi:hypothetical protein